MKKLISALFCITLLLTGGCEEDEYGDGQYGTTCFVSKLSIDKGRPTTTYEYDQHDMISSIKTTMEGGPDTEVDFTYNNNMAFADFYVDNQLVGTSEATLDAYNNVVSVQYTDASGEVNVELTYSYNSDHRPVTVSAYDFSLARVETLTIEWHDGNATGFVTSTTNHRCIYKTGQKSSLKIGKGNVFLQAQFFDANIGMFLSNDKMETYNADAYMGDAMNLTYDTDSDGKIRKIYWSTTSTNEFGTTNVEYDCHN